jgi:hypothetical protein
MPGRQGDMAARVQQVVAEARDMLAAIPSESADPAVALIRIRLAGWILSLESIGADAEGEGLELNVKGLLAKALSGADIDVDGIGLSLHDITQLAAALRPGASLTVRNSDSLSPIEQTSVWTVMPGQVRFV